MEKVDKEFQQGFDLCYNQTGRFAKENGVAMVLVNSNEAKREGDDSFPAMRKHAKEAGYTMVMNLAPKSHENALGNEDEILESMGIRYIHLPVVFTSPTRDDFERFIDALESCDDDRIWVHCAANMRVSAFFFKYRTERLGWTAEQAQADLHKIWEPGKLMGVWQDFIDKA